VLSFACPVCKNLVFFENSLCVTCKSALGYSRTHHTLIALTERDGGLHLTTDAGVLRPCANLTLARCNWLAPEGAEGGLCDACQLTLTRPSDDDKPALVWFARAEEAKRRLVFQLDDLRLPVTSRRVDREHGLGFDLLSSEHEKVVTGHSDGLITIDLAEGEDGHREALRVRLAEPYRTMLGHFRHETGHWYWDVLIDGKPAQQGFRELFGDERADYAQALEQHYGSDPEPGWQQRYVSVYASAHPWEDWAETFAHYLHMRDTLQTSSSFGIFVSGPEAPVRENANAPLTSLPDDDHVDFDHILDTWLPLTYALNAVNRSMGKDDLYPFVLSPTVIDKLRFVHALIADPARDASLPTS
jgi:hypothetical protein